MYGFNGMEEMLNRPYAAGLFSLIALWSIVWKGLALWRSAREESKWWFIALLVLNTAGIVEIAYLFFFAEEKLSLSMGSGSKKKSKSKK